MKHRVLPTACLPAFCPIQVVKQVQKNSSIIEQVVYAIAGAEIVTEPPHAGDVLDLQVGHTWHMHTRTYAALLDPCLLQTCLAFAPLSFRVVC
jgi:hypothetical protein